MELYHYGIKGQKWGIRRYQNEDGSLTEEGRRRYGNSVFISGTVKTMPGGEYERADLPKFVQDKLNSYISSGRKILVGDAPGIDTQVQDFLASRGYKNVEVFTGDYSVRQNSGKNLGWKVNKIESEGTEKERRAKKDEAMSFVASEGLAVVISNGSTATRNNIARLEGLGKDVAVYELEDSELKHHGIKGQRWGIRRYQNEDGTLTEAGKKHYAKLDDRWIRKNQDKVYTKAYNASKKELKRYVNTELRGVRGATARNLYNRKMAELFRQKTADIHTPSGKIVEWVAKRGEVGVYMAIADAGYNMENLKNGVWNSGRIGYRKDVVDRYEN